MADKNFKVKTGLSLPSPLPVDQGGTGQTSTTNTLNSLLPAQTGNANKVLQTDGTNTTWFTIPAAYSRGATGSRPGSPTAGDLFFNTDKKAFEVWTGSAWISLIANGAVPLAPTIGTATVSGLTASVPFTGPADFGDAAITLYTATSNPGGIAASNASSPISVSGLSQSTSYTFTVTATNSYGTSNASSASNSITTASVPGAPTSVTVSDPGTDGYALVSWTAPASNGGSAITDYTVQYSSNSGSSWTTFSDGTSTSTSATVTGLTLNTAYIFRVAAVNVIGTGSYSTVSSSFTPVIHDPSAFFPIATYTVPSAGTSSIVFSNIPQTYKHLQLRGTLRNTAINNYATININSGSYRQHNWMGNGTNPFIINSSTTTDIIASNKSDSTSLYFAPNIIDIEDYTSTSKNKVIRNISGSEQSTSAGFLWFSSMVSLNTGAVTSITLTPSSGNFAQYSQITLYGYQ